VMGGLKLGGLSTLGGIRTEWTEVQGRGIFERASLSSPTDRYGDTRTDSASYRNVFPGVHFKYEAGKIVGRASYNLSIARPNFRNIIPRISLNDTTLVVTANNPALKPQMSDNFDVTLEYYFEPIGLFSVGAFLKEIDDFQFTTETVIGTGSDNGFEGQFVGYRLSTQHNGGAARVRGIEANYRQQFNFLPVRWLKGFGAYANFTYLETQGTYDSGIAQLAGFIPKTGNVGLTYSAYGLTARVQGNYRGSYLNSFNANPLNRRYTLSRKLLDLNFEYVIRRGLSVSASFSNITNAPDPWYIGLPGRSSRYLLDGRKMTFSIGGRF